ncbi:MAG: rRNA maturation RNase YbeY, partial [Candidatus Enteromonas sp.]
MELEFDNRFDAQFDEWESKYESLLDVIASLLSIRKNYEIDLSLVGEEEIHTINRDYRGIDRVTDGISFAFEDDHSD